MEQLFIPTDSAVQITDKLDISRIEPGTLTRRWIRLVSDGMGRDISLPALIARGVEDGPVLGLTAAVHGNELNGIPIIQRVFRELDPQKMRGTVVGIPVVNVPSFLRAQRRFIDNVDLNHIMPGVPNGNVSQVYAYRLVDRIVQHFNYLIDLHTASFGRVNSYYIRADMDDPVTKELALLQNAQIVVNNPPSDGTLRGAADALGIPAVTLEVGDPNTFQKGVIRSGLTGIHNALAYLNITDVEKEDPGTPPIICQRSYWMYTDEGGILTVHPRVTDIVQRGQQVATVTNVWGDQVNTYKAPEDGVVIGKSVHPVNQTGGRILHLGII